MHDDQGRVTESDAGETGDEVEAYLAHIRANSQQWLASYTARHAATEQEIAARWGTAFAHFDVLVIVAQRALLGAEEAYFTLAMQRDDAMYKALYPLAIRACRTAKEVRVLMGAGYGDAASTRWRALHEIHVVARLIEMHGAPLASRYVQHNIVAKNKLAKKVEQVYAGLGKPVPADLADAIAEVRREYDEAAKKHASEPNFLHHDNGWATGYVRDTSFAALEAATGLADRRFAYSIASNLVHPNIAGAFAGSITTPDGEMLMICPSAEGMREPGASTALALVEISRILLRHVLQSTEGDTPIRRELALIMLAYEPLLQDAANAFQEADTQGDQTG